MTLQADLIAANEEIAAKQTRMADLLKDINDLPSTKAGERAAEIRAVNAELTDLGDKRDKLAADVAEIDKARSAIKAGRQSVRQVQPENEPTSSDDAFWDGGEVVAKSTRELLTQAMDEYPDARIPGKGFKSFRGSLGFVAAKTLITSADLTPQAERQTAIQPFLTEERTTVGDLLAQGTTTAQKIEYFEETTFTNAADTVAEGGEKPEGAIDFTLREANVRKIAVWVPVTDEMLADVPTFESYLRARLGFMVKQKEEDKLLNGTGGANGITGILQTSGIQTVTGYGLTTLDSLYRGMTEVRVDGFAEPDSFVVHPRDWEDIRLSKDDNGNYLLGPANDEGPARVWGLRVAVTTNIAENTGLVGAFRLHAQVFRRSGIEIAISTEHSDYFIYNKVAVRAEERLALAVYRPKAFCKIEALVQGS